MSTRELSPTIIPVLRSSILVIAPAVVMIGHGSHPWIGNPGDAEFFDRLAAAVIANPRHWALSHLMVAIGSALIALAFLAVRGYLRDAGENRWSAIGLPFVIIGCTFYAMLPAMEFAPIAAHNAGADVAAVQAGLMSWFRAVLLAAAVCFGLGILGFIIGLMRSGAVTPRLNWLIVTALAVLAITRFLPVGAAQLYIGPAASVVALWPLAYVVWKGTPVGSGARSRPEPSR